MSKLYRKVLTDEYSHQQLKLHVIIDNDGVVWKTDAFLLEESDYFDMYKCNEECEYCEECGTYEGSLGELIIELLDSPEGNYLYTAMNYVWSVIPAELFDPADGWFLEAESKS